MTGELVPRDSDIVEVPGVSITPLENPAGFVAGYVAVADELSRVIRDKKLSVKIRGRDHVRVEGWTLLGSMLGVFPVTVWSREMREDGVKIGWEARVEARTKDGAIVGAAEAECLYSESTWTGREDYALRSMAQTRATSKALRQPLGFVMTLAGFDATPAEEMPRAGGPTMISRDQARRLFAIATEHGVSEDALRGYVHFYTGQDSTKGIPVAAYEQIVAAVQNHEEVPFE